MRLLFILVATLLAGCASMGGRGAIDAIYLFGSPITLDMDGQPGPEGFGVRLYATSGGGAKGVAIQNGTTEIWMFDGVINPEKLGSQQPLQIWKFEPRDLNRITEVTSLGRGYRFTLRWDQKPKRGHITVIARHAPAKGRPIFSSPSTINAAVK